MNREVRSVGEERGYVDDERGYVDE